MLASLILSSLFMSFMRIPLFNWHTAYSLSKTLLIMSTLRTMPGLYCEACVALFAESKSFFKQKNVLSATVLLSFPKDKQNRQLPYHVYSQANTWIV